VETVRQLTLFGRLMDIFMPTDANLGIICRYAQKRRRARVTHHVLDIGMHTSLDSRHAREALSIGCFSQYQPRTCHLQPLASRSPIRRSAFSLLVACLRAHRKYSIRTSWTRTAHPVRLNVIVTINRAARSDTGDGRVPVPL
jgi:hypothetical protein